MATLEITVQSQMVFEPDSVHLLEGANVNINVMEVYKDKKIGIVK